MHLHPALRPLRPTPWLLSLVSQKAVTLGGLASLKPRGATPGALRLPRESRLARPCEKADGRQATGVPEPVLVCTHVHTQETSYPSPAEPLGTFSSIYYSSEVITLSQGPFGAWVRQEGKDRAGRRGICPLLCLRSPGFWRSSLYLPKLPLARPRPCHRPHTCRRPLVPASSDFLPVHLP